MIVLITGTKYLLCFRVADGVVAAEFIKELKKVIENPLELLL
jgi:hypothetical protein